MPSKAVERARARARGNEREGFTSTLPVWIIEDGTKKGTLHIQCPRCLGKSVVSEKLWIEQPMVKEGPFMGRSCTYCFSTSRLPRARMGKRAKHAYRKGD